MRTLESAVVATFAGPLVVVVDPEDGAILASGFDDLDEREAMVADSQTRFCRPRRSVALDPVRSAVTRYVDGELGALDRLLVRQDGGPFQQQAWIRMRAVPPGTTISYAELAAAAGRPRAVRAAGSACARNLVAPFVPCHRIRRADGSLGGYFYGLAVKEALLRHEVARR